MIIKCAYKGLGALIEQFKRTFKKRLNSSSLSRNSHLRIYYGLYGKF